MFRTIQFLAVVYLVNGALLSAQVTLEPKFPEDSMFTTQTEQKSKQTLVLAGMNIDTSSSTFSVATTTIGKRAADGTLEVKEQVNTLQAEIGFPGGFTIGFDSANPDKKAPIPQLEPILDALRAAVRLPMTLVLDAKNKIQKVKLPDGEFEKLPEAAKDRFSPEWLQKAAEQARAYLPDQPVNVGDSWERSHEMNAGDGQVMTFRTRYQYAGTVEQDGMTLDKITGKVLDVNYTVNGNNTLQVKSSDLKISDSSGTYLFDRKRGATISRVSKVQLAGPLTIIFNNNEIEGKVDLTLEENAMRK
jgi:hypothetical protein